MLNHSGPFCLPKDIFKKSADVSRLSSANGKPSLIRPACPLGANKTAFGKNKNIPKKTKDPELYNRRPSQNKS